MFTDEHDQSWLNPEITPDIMTTTLAGTTRFKLYTFTPLHNPGNWADWAAESGGRTFELTWNQNQMYENLMSIIDEACLGPSEEEQAQYEPQDAVFYTASHRYNYQLRLCF